MAMSRHDSRLRVAREAEEFRTYLRVREEVFRLLEEGPDAPSAYWREELSHIEYMLDASPLIVRKLREHCHWLTGIRPYEYRTHAESTNWQRAKLRALRAVDTTGLFVGEPRLLGGFGIQEGGAMFNLDTLKFYEALIALDLAGVLDELRDPERRVVWEIGGGWGGFAYQCMSLFSPLTYVITDFAELFLFSATYLLTAFPDATFRFASDAEQVDDAIAQNVDFVFCPVRASGAVTATRADAIVNMVSFQEMSTEQVEHYVDVSARLVPSFLYSLNRDRSLYNPDLTSVCDILRRRFSIEEVHVLDVSYPHPLHPQRRLRWLRSCLTRFRQMENDYVHVVGRPRR